MKLRKLMAIALALNFVSGDAVSENMVGEPVLRCYSQSDVAFEPRQNFNPVDITNSMTFIITDRNSVYLDANGSVGYFTSVEIDNSWVQTNGGGFWKFMMHKETKRFVASYSGGFMNKHGSKPFMAIGICR